MHAGGTSTTSRVVEGAIGKVLRDRSLKSDTVHPNAEGQKVLAEAVAD